MPEAKQPTYNNLKNELHSIPVPNQVMAQVGVDLCTLPNIDRFCHLVVCIGKTNQRQNRSNCATIFIRNDVSAWLLFRANQ